jgi:hypothetical protein
VEAKDTEGLQRLIEYFLRCPLSQARMIEVTAQGKVIYKTGDTLGPNCRANSTLIRGGIFLAQTLWTAMVALAREKADSYQ